MVFCEQEGIMPLGYNQYSVECRYEGDCYYFIHIGNINGKERIF